MRTCEEITDLISAGLDGELTPAQERELAEHLAACPECRALAEDLKQLHAAMPHLNETPPAFLVENVMARIKAETPQPIPFPVKKNHRRQWQALGAAAAVFAVVLAGSFVLRGGMSQGGDSGTPMTLGIAPESQPMPSTAPSATPSPTAEPASGESETLPMPASTPQTTADSTAPAAPKEDPAQNATASIAQTEDEIGATGGEETPAPRHFAFTYSGERQVTPTPKEAAPVPSPTPAPVPEPTPTPMSEPTPAPSAAVAGGSVTDPQERSAILMTGLSVPLTAEKACQTVFEYLKAMNYPNLGTTTPWEGATLTGSAENGDLTYTLGLVTINGETQIWKIAYKGQSLNRSYYEFNLYADVTSGGESRVVQAGWYGVLIDGGSILSWQDDPEGYVAAVNGE